MKAANKHHRKLKDQAKPPITFSILKEIFEIGIEITNSKQITKMWIQKTNKKMVLDGMATRNSGQFLFEIYKVSCEKNDLMVRIVQEGI